MNLQYSGEPGSSLELEETAPTLEKLRHPKRIPVKCRQRNRFIPAFLIGVAVISLVSLLYLGIDWGKMASRIPDIGVVFWDLAHFAPLPELMDRKKRDIMERKGDKEDENKRQKQQKESSAAAL